MMTPENLIGSPSAATNGEMDGYVAKFDLTSGVVRYVTRFGGSDSDIANSLAVDSSGRAYVAGYTFSADFPTLVPAPLRAAPGDTIHGDAYLLVLTADGTALEFSGLLGGSDREWADAITLGPSGLVYIVGATYSTDFPTWHALRAQKFSTRTKNQDMDGFLTVLQGVGTPDASLVYSTFLGGSKLDNALAVTCDANDLAYVTGTTLSSDFPLKNALISRFVGNNDAYVTKIDPWATGAGSLIYSTYLVCSAVKAAYDIAIDESGSIYVGGKTGSTDFPVTTNAFDRTLGSEDAFLTRLSPAGNTLLYSTFLGGPGGDRVEELSLSQGKVFMTGAASNGFPLTPDAVDSVWSGTGYDAYVSVLDTNLWGSPSLIYSTYLGGSYTEVGCGIAALYPATFGYPDPKGLGAICIAGVTESPDLFASPVTAYFGALDGFLTVIVP
ncbi:MAG: hypothetical protein EHM61_09920 [Acidobacteria bacterium]|nr:MAG: hypothetical protein EHM61_09920 [Acidobacteriota bacterium]